MLTVKEINEVSFGKAGFSGYKPEDVDNFIDEVVESFTQLQAERDDAVQPVSYTHLQGGGLRQRSHLQPPQPEHAEFFYQRPVHPQSHRYGRLGGGL